MQNCYCPHSRVLVELRRRSEVFSRLNHHFVFEFYCSKVCTSYNVFLRLKVDMLSWMIKVDDFVFLYIGFVLCKPIFQPILLGPFKKIKRKKKKKKHILLGRNSYQIRKENKSKS